ncbi:unnamed protein product [Allacma fusca]|uniref:Uncharacterized protein n=1 Tax=Allacma fusca TaxID=39272 RepID=A0A8J2PJV9_9HEXA|nr:unnamed protein product [Allacma fusca]
MTKVSSHYCQLCGVTSKLSLTPSTEIALVAFAVVGPDTATMTTWETAGVTLCHSSVDDPNLTVISREVGRTATEIDSTTATPI